MKYCDVTGNGLSEDDTPLGGTTIYIDADNDGKLDAGEPRTTTNSSGYYAFTNLKASGPGGYTITETQPDGYADGKDRIGSQGGTAGNDVLTTVQLNSNTSGVNNNFGERTSAGTASIGNHVWLEKDLDGQQDSGESGVCAVTVKLKDSNGTVIATTTTDSNGYYSFDNLAAGTYRVQFVLPCEYGFTLEDAGSDDARDSDADMSTGLTGSIALAAGESNRTIDAGLYKKPSERLGCEGKSASWWKANAQNGRCSAWPISSGTTVASLFASTAGTSAGNRTLLQQLCTTGGGTDALLREAIAAYLNARSSSYDCAMYSTQVVLNVNAAIYSGNSTAISNLKSKLAGYNS